MWAGRIRWTCTDNREDRAEWTTGIASCRRSRQETFLIRWHRQENKPTDIVQVLLDAINDFKYGGLTCPNQCMYRHVLPPDSSQRESLAGEGADRTWAKGKKKIMKLLLRISVRGIACPFFYLNYNFYYYDVLIRDINWELIYANHAWFICTVEKGIGSPRNWPMMMPVTFKKAGSYPIRKEEWLFICSDSTLTQIGRR
jgi:hypothetical protein